MCSMMSSRPALVRERTSCPRGPHPKPAPTMRSLAVMPRLVSKSRVSRARHYIRWCPSPRPTVNTYSAPTTAHPGGIILREGRVLGPGTMDSPGSPVEGVVGYFSAWREPSDDNNHIYKLCITNKMEWSSQGLQRYHI